MEQFTRYIKCQEHQLAETIARFRVMFTPLKIYRSESSAYGRKNKNNTINIKFILTYEDAFIFDMKYDGQLQLAAGWGWIQI